MPTAARHGIPGTRKGCDGRANPRYRRRKTGAPDRIRTCDLRLRRPTLYPLSYRRACAGEHVAAVPECSRGAYAHHHERRLGDTPAVVSAAWEESPRGIRNEPRADAPPAARANAGDAATGAGAGAGAGASGRDTLGSVVVTACRALEAIAPASRPHSARPLTCSRRPRGPGPRAVATQPTRSPNGYPHAAHGCLQGKRCHSVPAGCRWASPPVPSSRSYAAHASRGAQGCPGGARLAHFAALGRSMP